MSSFSLALEMDIFLLQESTQAHTQFTYGHLTLCPATPVTIFNSSNFLDDLLDLLFIMLILFLPFQ